MSEEVKQLDPKQVEQVLLEREEKRFEQDPVSIASMMMKMYYPRFVTLVNQLSSKQKERMLKSLVGYPLEGEYKHTNKLEQEAFAIGSNLLDAKQVLIMSTYHENREKILKQAEQEMANSTIETVMGEEAQEILNKEKEEVNNG